MTGVQIEADWAVFVCAFLRFCKSERDKGRPSGHVKCTIYGCQSKNVLGEKFLGESCEELRLNLYCQMKDHYGVVNPF